MSEFRYTTIGEPEGDLVFQMANAIREAIIPFMDPVDPHHTVALSMTAACTYAGIQIGTLIAMGVATPKDKKRMVDMMTRNVRLGIDLGTKHMFRVAGKLAGEEGHA